MAAIIIILDGSAYHVELGSVAHSLSRRRKSVFESRPSVVCKVSPTIRAESSAVSRMSWTNVTRLLAAHLRMHSLSTTDDIQPCDRCFFCNSSSHAVCGPPAYTELASHGKVFSLFNFRRSQTVTPSYQGGKESKWSLTCDVLGVHQKIKQRLLCSLLSFRSQPFPPSPEIT